MPITRRDFLNGVALAVGTGLSPLQMFGPAIADDAYYPPALTGLRGHHPGAFETGHRMGLDGEVFDVRPLPVKEEYDLVVVGAGVSGLAAAWFYREKHPGAKILILDNHDDFGGHAKRNEFTADGRLIIGYGGSESFQSPKSLFGPEARHLLDSIGIDINRFNTAFHAKFYPDLGLSRGVFFDAEHFAEAKLVSGDPQPVVADDLTEATRNGRPWAEFIADFPLPADDRAKLVELHVSPKDYLPSMSVEEKVHYLHKTSYHDFLTKNAGLSPAAAQYFQNRCNDFLTFCTDGMAAFAAYEFKYPGFAGMNLPPPDARAVAEMEEPYIYHFPDGNAGLARMIVRSLIPSVAPGNTMDDIVLAKFDYSKLDQPENQVRIRVSSMAVDVRNADGGVDVGYMRFDEMTKVRGKHCVLAGFNMLIPFIFKEVPEAQAAALRHNVKRPIVHTKVILSNWEPFIKAGVHEIYSPTRPYSRVKLDYPVDLGGYEFPRDPKKPILVHMVYTPTPFGTGIEDGRELSRMGRGVLLGMAYEDHEEMIKTQLKEMLGPYGYDEARDLMAITVNRWSHGYAWEFNSLFDETEEAEKTKILARTPIGNVTIANSDSEWVPYIHGAVPAAWRAVNELSG